MKIIDIINNSKSEIPIQISLEFFPPKTPQGIENLKKRVEKMVKEHQPIFLDLTWGAGGGSKSNQTTKVLTEYWNSKLNYPPVNMHLTCTNMSLDQIKEILDEMYEKGIENIVALRGDPAIKDVGKKPHFECSLDLIEHIREFYDDFFCITTAGYPEGHPDLFVKVNNLESLSKTEYQRMVKYDQEYYVCPDDKYEESLKYLRRKAKLSDVIITQLFYDCDLYLKFVKDCRKIGISCPIIPGIMLIQNYQGFKKMTKFCKTKVPEDILEHVEMIKDESEKVEAYGVELGKKMCKKLMEKGGVKNVHLYTLNKNKSVDEVIKFIREKK